MRLVRYGDPGRETPGVLLDNQTILDVRGMAFDIGDYNAHFFTTAGFERLQGLMREKNPKTVATDSVRLGPPVAMLQKIVCLGKNYEDHAKEFDSEIPDSPVVFSKAPSAINGPADPIVLPPNAGVVDVEVELAIVIGRRTKCVSETEALGCVAGYTILNDVTDRTAQKAGKQWYRGKSPDTFCPIGPYLVTADEIDDPQNLDLYSKVNGTTLQSGNTKHMIFKIPFLISFISQATTLMPGDVVATGTPGGIGSAKNPPIVLKAGDSVEVGVEGLGIQACSVQ